MDKIHVRFSISQPCLTDAVIVILNGLLSYEHPSKKREFLLLPILFSPILFHSNEPCGCGPPTPH